MEPNETQQQLSSSYFHQPPTSTNITLNVAAPSPTNGLLPSNDGAHMVSPHSVPSAVMSPLEPARRKRGRPRKYGTPEQALAAKKTASSSNNSSSARMRREQAGSAASSSYSGSSRKSQLVALGNAGQGFTPHVINVAAGEVCTLFFP
ncbi:AT-hook motif nuclear-localized protein 14 [Carica papaya]|uniref:AT-hook motif nuclear-localized protein 14 n=1 Tax=Carica papaya TaxID=3649 RepID=UPI000B8CE3FC|nr:AT-hook motif nuclear-localized protein 14 [Carica papaya]